MDIFPLRSKYFSREVTDYILVWILHFYYGNGCADKEEEESVENVTKKSMKEKAINRRRFVSGRLVPNLFGSSIKFTLRKLKAQKGLSFLNIACLSIGMACFIILALWIQHEMNFDRFHENGDRIFRVVSRGKKDNLLSPVSWRLALLLKDKSDDIEACCRIRKKNASLIKYMGRRVYEQRFYLSDPSFFKIFDFPFIAGNPETALSELDSIVITEETAFRYFGKSNPMGKVLRVIQFGADFKVTGVIRNIPANSHLQFDLISRIEWLGKRRLESWEALGFSYLMLSSSANSQIVSRMMEKYFRESDAHLHSELPFLQPLTRIHSDEFKEMGSGNRIYIFSALTLFLLILVCINFANLSTASLIKAAKEVGIRKVIGATRIQIIYHFLGESLISSFLAFISALMLVLLTLPAFNRFFSTELKFASLINILILLLLLGLVLLIAFLAGSYPMIFLSSFHPVHVLKGKFNLGGKSTLFRKIFVTLQFSVAIGFIICSLIIHKQLDFIKGKNLGFNQDSVVTFFNHEEIKAKFTEFKEKLLNYSNIVNVTASSSRPILARDEVMVHLKSQTENVSFRANYSLVDFDFFATFQMDVFQGRPFSNEFPQDRTQTCVINESAAREMGALSPLGKTIYYDHPDFAETYKELKIIGIVRDFHSQSMHQTNRPFIFRFYRPWHFSVFVRMKSIDIENTLAKIEEVFREYAPHQPFNYEFFDDTFKELYQSEIQLGSVFKFTGILAILISLLGLFGLASSVLEQKVREISIRKVFGAKVPGIIFSLSKEFVQGVFIANLIAGPIAYLIMNKWMQNFATRIRLGLDVFIVALFFTLFTALVTVACRIVKAATACPIEHLRQE